MPEYLAPGVYVEEIDTGSKPIEGVSTSTAGMVGVTERGPANAPILVTSYGEYVRWFGERLRQELYSNGADRHCYLPTAVEGFFTNGRKRVYITCALDVTLARRAATMLFDRGAAPSGSTMLLRATRENTGTALNPPLLVVLDGTNLAQNDWIRIGDGSDAEYRRINAPLTAETVLVPLSFPLSRSHAASGPINVEQFTPAAPVAALTTVGDSHRGDQTLELTGAAADIAALAIDDLLEIGATANVAEHRFIRQVTSLSATNARALFDSPLMRPYAAATATRKLTLGAGPPAAQLDPAARAGETLLFVDNRGGNFDTRTDLIVIDSANTAEREVRRIGELRLMTVTPGAAEAYPAGALVEGVNLGDDTSLTLTANSAIATNTITVSDVTTLLAGQTLLVGPAGALETVVIQSINPATRVVTLTAPLVTAKAIGHLVIPVRLLTAPTAAGATFIALNNRMGLAEGDILRIGAAPDDEYARIRGLPNRAPAGVGPDAGNVLLSSPLLRNHAVANTPVVRQAPVTATAVQPTFLALAAAAGGDRLLLADGNGYAPPGPPASSFVRLTTATGVFFHRVTALTPDPPLVGSVAPVMIALDAPLDLAHSVGSPVVERSPMLNVEALDAGIWGNRLRVSVEDEDPGLVSRTILT